MILFFYLHFTWLCGHEIIFENMATVFLLRCQNSLRWEISLICHWNIDSWKQKMSVGYLMVPNIDQNIIWIQYRLHLVRTITKIGQYWWKYFFLHAWKCIISGVFHRCEFWHLWRKPAIIFSKWLFFKKSLVISWFTQSSKMQVKRFKRFWTFYR